jgi:hypothetical protein
MNNATLLQESTSSETVSLPRSDSQNAGILAISCPERTISAITKSSGIRKTINELNIDFHNEIILKTKMHAI